MTMVSDLTVPMRRSWMSRLFGGLRAPRSGGLGLGLGFDPSGDQLQGMTRQLIADDRYTFVLLRAAEAQIEDRDARPAWKAVQDQMALVPGGVVPVVQSDGSLVPIEVPAFYLDRCAVTNYQYQRFVRAGGYEALEIWPREVWPGLMKLVDRTSTPGPVGWEQGRFPAGKADHPVVGVGWYEAMAYARWVGKRLATAAEWQKAGGWPEQLSGGSCSRYPWGDVFDPTRANLWASGLGRTVPVHEFARGATPNGIAQMTGNVWEWLEDPLESIPCRPDETFQAWQPLRRIVGGAFDTYLPGEATCHFVTGQAVLDRRPNIGFRCAVSVERLRPIL